MIIQPDFLDHWKTRLLVELLGGDELAPLYVMRIWAHCQNRKTTTLERVGPAGLKALCRFAGDAETLMMALRDAGFISYEDGRVGVEVCNWGEHNQALISAWENGKRGGRPKTQTKPTGNRPVTETKPTGNPTVTETEPNDNRLVTDMIRLDKTREDKRGREKKFLPPSVEEVAAYAASLAYELNAEKFVAFYEQKGWMVGKNRMKDWRAAVRNWKANDRPSASAKGSDPAMDILRKRMEASGDWE